MSKEKEQPNQPPSIRETSPITIGGGSSVGLGFDHEHYTQNAPNEYSHATDEIDTVLIISRYGKPMHNLLKEVNGKNVTITVSSKDSGNTDSPIVFESQPGGPLKVKFTDTEYPYDGAKEVHYNKKERKMRSLVVRNNDTGVSTPFSVDHKGTIVVFDF